MHVRNVVAIIGLLMSGACFGMQHRILVSLGRVAVQCIRTTAQGVECCIDPDGKCADCVSECCPCVSPACCCGATVSAVGCACCCGCPDVAACRAAGILLFSSGVIVYGLCSTDPRFQRMYTQAPAPVSQKQP